MVQTETPPKPPLLAKITQMLTNSTANLNKNFHKLELIN